MIHRIFIAAAAALSLSLIAAAPADAAPKAKSKVVVAQAAHSSTAKAKPAPRRGAKSSAKAQQPKVKKLDFREGSDIEGGVGSPNGDVVSSRPDTVHTNLIRLRQDFIPEIFKSADSL